MSLATQLDKMKSPRILVLGDLILDRYTFGNAERVSPEAPVLVLRSDAQEVRLGGAASVAFLLRALGAEVTLAGVLGDAQGERGIFGDAHIRAHQPTGLGRERHVRTLQHVSARVDHRPG